MAKSSVYPTPRPLGNTNNTLLLTYCHLAEQPPSLLNVPEEKFSTPTVTSYVLNSGVTEPNLTKFLHVVQKSLPITLLKPKLRSSNPFGNGKVRNEDRCQIAGALRQKLCVLTA